MVKSSMNLTSERKPHLMRPLKAMVVLGVMAASLAGCVVYPNGGYGGGYYGGGYAYAPAPAYVAPPVTVGFGFGGGYWHHGWGHRHWR